MPLHMRDEVRDDLYGDVYASRDLSVVVPKYKVPEHEHEASHAYAIVHDELMLDGNSRMNLATFCQTWVEPELHTLMDECLYKNMIDKDEYPRTADIESRVVQMLADLWSAPDASNAVGCSTTGSSEAAMLGGLAMKWRWRKQRERARKPADRPNLICGPVQICWHKFARYFDVELRQVPVEKGQLTLSGPAVVARCDENTIGVVPTLGVTYTLVYEPVKAISDALDELQRQRGLDVPIHVDAASGGFIAPFIHREVPWDFRLPRVKSINASGHKFGLTPLGCGWALWRERSDLPDDLVFYVDYLGGDMPTFALNFSRPGGQVVAQYYNLLRLGREGYKKVHQSCSDTAKYIADAVAELGPFDVLYDGRGGIPGAVWTLKQNGESPAFTLYDLAERLRIKGWQVPAYPLPDDCQDVVVQRALVRHGVSRDLARLLVGDIRGALDHFRKHPVTSPLTREEGSGFHH
jgi:glutamate decarboxylase